MASLTQGLLQSVYSCISDFNEFYAKIIGAPREHWASMMEGAFIAMLSHHMEILRLGKIVAESTDTLPYPVVPETFTMAINAGSNVHLKSQRREAFEAMAKQADSATVEIVTINRIQTTITFTEEDLRELSYLVPGHHGWVLVYPPAKIGWILDMEQFRIECQVPRSTSVGYGVYKASIMLGQAMSGLEFAQLSQNTRNNIAKSVCASSSGGKTDSSEFRVVMEDLLHSRITLSCIFLECLEGPAAIAPSPIINGTVPTYRHILPLRDPICDFTPRLIRTESDGFEYDTLIDFSADGTPPFGVIGDCRQGFIATSTPNLSEGGETPTLAREVSGEGPFDINVPLRPIVNGQVPRPVQPTLSLSSSLPLSFSVKDSAEYSFSNDQDSPPDRFSLGMVNYYDDSDNIGQENRPSSALVSIVSGGEPIPTWNSCRLRKMTSAPSMPREIRIQNANANGGRIGNEEGELKLFW